MISYDEFLLDKEEMMTWREMMTSMKFEVLEGSQVLT
jgi:hypothetical protein